MSLEARSMSAPDLDDRGIPSAYPFKPEVEVGVRDLQRALAAGGSAPLLIDVRMPDEWEVAHVPGAVLLPLHELEARADEIETAKDAPIAVMCHHGARSLRAALLLRAMGFTNARSVVGGIDLWSRAVDPSIPRYAHAGGRFVRVAPGAA